MDAASSGVYPLDYAEPVRRRWTGFRIFKWVMGIVVVSGMAASIFLPTLCRAREPSNRAKCASNLHQIGLAISLYAADNGGQYPPSLAALLKEEQLVPAVMVCPSSSDEAAMADDKAGNVAEVEAAETNVAGHKNVLSYVYIGKGLTEKTALATTVVAFEPLNNHQGDGTDVLFGDGHTEWVAKDAWLKMAAKAGVKVVVSAATQP